MSNQGKTTHDLIKENLCKSGLAWAIENLEGEHLINTLELWQLRINRLIAIEKSLLK